MNILLTGACGFAGSSIAHALLDLDGELAITGLDNFSRPGSPTNVDALRQRRVRMIHGDVRLSSDLETIGRVDWVIDAAANPSVLAGVDGKSSSRQVIEHNLISTVNLLEFCRQHGAGFVLLSTSRVYSIPPLAGLPLIKSEKRFELDTTAALPAGITARGIDEDFSVAAPISLYGATKLASEVLALEFAETFGVPVWINRCGVMAGTRQFGRADQGIVSYWINGYLRKEPLRYIGFGGGGRQVRDAVHPRDVATLIFEQLRHREAAGRPRLVNLGGGIENMFSLAELTQWCARRFEHAREISDDPKPRPLDLPWVVMNAARAEKFWKWRPRVTLDEIFEEIATHAEQHPDWLRLSAPY
jgi:CDP-paratose 2-epimerase